MIKYTISIIGRMEIEPRKDWDIFSMALLTVLLILAIYLLPDSVLRTIIGLPFLLFFPGYLAIAALFPAREDLDDIERVALSFGLSIAITPLIGFGLNYTPWGIRLTPILLSVSAFIFLAAAVSLYRRQSVTDPFRPFDPFQKWQAAWSSFQAEKGLDKALSVILILSILSSVFALGYVIAFPKQGESFTEFYVLGPEGRASGYPQLEVGENGTVILGLVNHEHQEMNYTIMIWLVKVEYTENQTLVHEMYFYDALHVTDLEHVPVDIEQEWQSQWEQTYDFNIFTVDNPLNGSYKLWFNLFKENVSVDYVVGEDYSDDAVAVEYIEEAVKNQRQSLNLNMHLRPTHFYLLDQDGNATGLPYNVTANQTVDVRLGLANYEGQTMDYEVLVMIGNLSIPSDGNTSNITYNGLFYLDTFSSLDWQGVVNRSVAPGDPWTEQVETNYSFVADDLNGSAQVWFILYKDSSPPALSTHQDYSADTSVQQIMKDSVAGGLQYIVLPLMVSA